MKLYKSVQTSLLILAISSSTLLMSACNPSSVRLGATFGDQHHRPPPGHAPAYGHRGQHHYHYYPSASVYFDTGSNMYFYLSGGSWAVSTTLPSSVRVHLGSPVDIRMDSDKPYSQYKHHQKKYPPGLAKKKNRGKGNGKGRGKSKGKGKWDNDDD